VALHFGPDVSIRQVMQLLLEEHGVVAAYRATGKTTALLEYVALRSFRLKKSLGILCFDDKMMKQIHGMFRSKFYPFKYEPVFHCYPEWFRNHVDEVYVDEPWKFEIQRLRAFDLIPIYGAIGTPDGMTWESCSITKLPSPSLNETGLDKSPWNLAKRWCNTMSII
jgi:hypothetical protein